MFIAGSAIPQGRDYVTKKDGVFLFQAVPPGAYTVLVAHPSMADFAIEVLVNVDRQTAVNVEMSEVGRVSEEVTVQAVSPVIDLKSTEVSASWQKDLVEKLPMGPVLRLPLPAGAGRRGQPRLRPQRRRQQAGQRLPL
ncbi:MAG: carboxypeptidase-like regulatory domain-containing protein [Candidatus Moduliflexus flocculans]|nr:carboxypeptidase-like regulatory domain-containing protein [Candidatus Moduliflexus flocculans]